MPARVAGCLLPEPEPPQEASRYEREVAADLAMRRDRFDAGGPFWTDDALGKVYNPDNPDNPDNMINMPRDTRT